MLMCGIFFDKKRETSFSGSRILSGANFHTIANCMEISFVSHWRNRVSAPSDNLPFIEVEKLMISISFDS